jgi:hypothetical protein
MKPYEIAMLSFGVIGAAYTVDRFVVLVYKEFLGQYYRSEIVKAQDDNQPRLAGSLVAVQIEVLQFNLSWNLKAAWKYRKDVTNEYYASLKARQYGGRFWESDEPEAK